MKKDKESDEDDEEDDNKDIRTYLKIHLMQLLNE